MSQIVVDEELRAKLNGLQVDAEFVDASGKPLGMFIPTEEYKKLMHAWLKSQVNDDELEKACQETGGRSLAEIWERLGAR